MIYLTVEPQEAPLLTNRIKHSDSTCTQVLPGDFQSVSSIMLITN